jgi:predicted dinucleotide-binding enzyme
MILGVIGAGHLGASVGSAVAAGGHEVILASRHPESLRAPGPRMRTASVQEAARDADVLLLSTPYRALPGIADVLTPFVAGTIVLDATNPDPGDDDELSAVAQRDGVGVTTQRFLPEARMVRAFSSINAGQVPASRNAPTPLAVPVAGDDPDAVAVVEQLVRDAACTPVVTGDLASGRIFEWGGPACLVDTDELHMRRILAEGSRSE